MLEKIAEELMGIEIFLFEECIVEDNGYNYTDVEFRFKTLEKYNGRDISVAFNWDIQIWDREGTVICEFNIIDIPDFRVSLKKRMEEDVNE